MATEVEQPITRLVCKKGKFTFEMWVQIEGRPLEIYGETVGEDGVTEAWIPSEEGKFYSICLRVAEARKTVKLDTYPDMYILCDIDGAHIKALSCQSDRIRSERGYALTVADRRVSETEVQKLMFTKPVLTDHETPALDIQRLATIEVSFRRCQDKPTDRVSAFRDASKGSVTAVNEASKKEALLSAITAFGEPLVCARGRKHREITVNPQDQLGGYFRMRLRYAPRDFLQALGHVPLKLNIKPGEAGLTEDQPIAVDDDGPLAGPSRSKQTSGVDANDVRVKAEELALRDSAELEALEEQHRMSLSVREPRPRPDDEEDDKENIIRKMGKKLKVAKEDDNGFVDLTFDDE